MGGIGLIAGGWAWGIAKYHRDWLNEGMYFATWALLNLLIKVWFAFEAGRQLAEDRREGALELLLSTPLTVRELLRGQLLALRRQFLGPAAAVLAAFLLFMIASSSEVTYEDDRTAFVTFWAGAMLILAADLAGLYWVGMWQGLTAKNPIRAASASLARILILPCVAMTLISLVISLMALRRDINLGPKSFLGLWFGLSVAADLGFGLWARYLLLREFRRAAARRYAPRSAFWKRWLGKGEPRGAAMPPSLSF